jgi:hypothetical protein
VEKVTGSSFDDILRGSSGDDELQGGDGDDTFQGRGGDDYFGGGDGLDTAQFGGVFGNYILTLDGNTDTIDISDKRIDGTGFDSFDRIELLQFADGASFVAPGAIDLRALTGALSLSDEVMDDVIALYISFFDRAPDVLGLLYWGNAVADGLSMARLSEAFVTADETARVFPDNTDFEAFVTAQYNNVLERDPDTAGKAFWVGALERGELTRDEFAVDFLNGASANDSQTLEDKTAIARAFSLDAGLNNTSNAGSVMDIYDPADREGSVAQAESLIAGYRSVAEDADSTEIVVEVVGLGADPLLT